MTLRSIGILSVALASGLALGACTNMNGDRTVAGALNDTKAASLPAVKAPQTLPNKGGKVHPNTPPLAETKAADIVYGGAPNTLPEGNRLTNQQIQVTFRGRRTRFLSPYGPSHLTFGNRTVRYERSGVKPKTGRWRVEGNRMCVKWPNMAENCYSVYAAGTGQYTVWLKNRPRGRIFVR
jgi:hypothetical protein